MRFLRKRGAGVEEYIGDGFIAPDVLIDDSNYSLISIGRGTTIAARVIILTHDCSIRKALNVIGMNVERKNYQIMKKVDIGRNVFIGAGSILLPGTEIGDNAVIAAGSVVKGIVPRGMVFGGGAC